MARVIDFGEGSYEDSDARVLQPAPSTRKLSWSVAEHRYTLLVLSTPIPSFGRASETDVCLRIVPTNEQVNRDKTFRISALHFQMRYDGERVLITDPGSSNGTILKSVGRLSAGVAVAMPVADEVTVANVLTLAVDVVRRTNPVAMEPIVRQQVAAASVDAGVLTQLLVGLSKAGAIDFVRMRRVDNCPDDEYALLFGQGVIDSSGEAIIRLPKAIGTGSRGLDLGGEDAGPIARLFWLDGELMLGVLRNDMVRYNDHELKQEDAAPLRPGDVVVGGGLNIRVES